MGRCSQSTRCIGEVNCAALFAMPVGSDTLMMFGLHLYGPFSVSPVTNSFDMLIILFRCNINAVANTCVLTCVVHLKYSVVYDSGCGDVSNNCLFRGFGLGDLSCVFSGVGSRRRLGVAFRSCLGVAFSWDQSLRVCPSLVVGLIGIMGVLLWEPSPMSISMEVCSVFIFPGV